MGGGSSLRPIYPQDAVLHDALFGQVDGSRLTLRSVEWAEATCGRVNLGEASTVTATATLSLQAPPAPPRWGMAAQPYLDCGRIRAGILVETYRGPVTLGGGWLRGEAYAIIGFGY